jgi:hypothetical protein
MLDEEVGHPLTFQIPVYRDGMSRPYSGRLKKLLFGAFDVMRSNLCCFEMHSRSL